MFYDNLRTLGAALRNPRAAARYLKVLIREAAIDRAAWVSSLLNAPPDRVAMAFQELRTAQLNAIIRKRIADRRGLPVGGMTTSGRGPVLYAISRLMKPSIVVETGVASGVSSTYILASLQANGGGRLFSIDFPNSADTLPTGWLVPENLKDRWELLVGKSSERLPILLREIGEVDIFLHDSDHSYENMMSEFHFAWPHIRPGGLLLSDDTDVNNAFSDFAKGKHRRPIQFYLLGAIRK